MADVTVQVGRRRDRAQLMLVAALGLAILFVSLALIVNTAIYTENLATRSSDIGGGTEAVRYHDAVRTGVGDLIEYANFNENASYDTLREELVAGTDTFDNHTAMQFALSARSVNSELNGTANGTRIAQTDPDRNFRNRTDTFDWTVVEDVNHTREFVINVTDAAFLATPGSGNEFQLTLTGDGGNTWVLNVTNDGSTTVGITNGDNDEFTCTESSTPVINVTAGTVDGSSCNGLDLGEGIDTPYTISFTNGDTINGTYTFIVDNDTLAGNVGTNDHLVADGSGQPFAAHAIYSANLTVTYETPRLFYNASVRVAPGESDG